MFFYGPLHKNVPVLADQQEFIYISSVQALDVVWKIWEQWMIGMDREKESGKSVLNDDIYMYVCVCVCVYIYIYIYIYIYKTQIQHNLMIA